MADKDTSQSSEHSSIDADEKALANEPAQTINGQVKANDVAESSTKASGKGTIRSLRRYVAPHWLHKKWTLPVTALVILLIVFAIPFSRYKILGLFLKEVVTVTVTDSTTNSPVAGAQIQSGAFAATTSASGKTTLKMPVGNGSIVITKQYYKTATQNIFISFVSSKNIVQVQMVATGRQVPVVIINKVTGKPVAGAELKVLDTETQTDNSGKATIVLPVNAPVQSGSISAKGYNGSAVNVQVTGQAVTANTFSLTPAGSIYFLSNLSGKIDVVKTNLDGSNRKTVLAGTGNETPGNTVLLATRDWKYLALYAQRNPTGNPEIDLIDTSTDMMANIDEGNATFNLTGWDGHNFVYIVNRIDYQQGQSKAQAIKSYNADGRKLTTLAETDAANDTSKPWYKQYYQQTFGGVAVVGTEIVYAQNVFTSTTNLMQGKQAQLVSVQPDGSFRKIIKAYNYPLASPVDYPLSLDINLTVDDPMTIYFQANASSEGSYPQGPFDSSVYQYQNGQVTQRTDLKSTNSDNGQYITYLLSPSGNQTFWSVPADGKNTLNVGDKDGNNANKVAILSDYNPYGWFTDNYLLVSKNSSELYIMPVGGGTPLKISDYFKPFQFFRGYGGGYGGL